MGDLKVTANQRWVRGEGEAQNGRGEGRDEAIKGWGAGWRGEGGAGKMGARDRPG